MVAQRGGHYFARKKSFPMKIELFRYDRGIYHGSVKMFKNLERSWGFHPRHFGSPQCDNPREGNNSTIAQRTGGQGGQALSTPSKICPFYFIL
jgi:hypothetical protein